MDHFERIIWRMGYPPSAHIHIHIHTTYKQRCSTVTPHARKFLWQPTPSADRFCSVLVNRAKSSSHTVVFECATNISKKKESNEKNEGSIIKDCNYMIIWRKHTKRGKTKWDLDVNSSVLQHVFGCSSGQKVSKRELKANHKLVSFIEQQPESSLKAIQEYCKSDTTVFDIGLSKKLISNTRFNTLLIMYELNVIKAQILRDRIDILHQGGKFYNDGWCKLREWSRTFQEENQGSLVDIQVDDDGKFLRMFVSVKPCIDIALACGMQFSAVDATHT